jgi:hypothetical protein
MKKGFLILGAAGLGAGLMYILDPSMGKERRTNALNSISKTGSCIGSKARQIGTKTQGLFADALLKRGHSNGTSVPAIAEAQTLDV